MSTLPQDNNRIWSTYNESDFIDAKDNQGDWRVGYIVGKYDHSKMYKVRFDGWSAKYDESYKASSYKLQPFRSLVIGYTGQVQNPGLRQDWKYSIIKHQERVVQMLTFMAAPTKYSVHEINQLLRGHNYFYNDFLMTVKYHKIQEIASTITYFDMNAQFLAQYLRNISENVKQYIANIGQNKDIGTWTSQQAYFRSYYEVFDTNYTSWGCYGRLQGFFKDNADLIIAHLDPEFSSRKEGIVIKDVRKLLQKHLTQTFMKHGGYESIRKILDQMLAYQQIIPFLFLSSLAHLLSAVYISLENQEKQSIIEKFIQIGDNNLSRIKDTHLKELHRHHVSNFFSALTDFSLSTKFHDGIEEWATERQIQLALKFILCPYFQKKLNGITFMINVLEKNDVVLKNGFFKQWAERQKLYETLFLSNDNPELVKKACELAKYIFVKGNLTQNNIDLILKSRQGKHETVLKEIYQLVAQFALYENSLEAKLKLFEKVSNLPEDQWDEDYIHMIRELSENSYGLNMKQKLLHPFGLDMVYRYALKVESQFALNELNHILHRVEKSKVYNKFQEDCFLKIQKKQHIWIHIKILLAICSSRIDTFDTLEIELLPILVNCLVEHAEIKKQSIIENGLELLTQITRNTAKQINVQDLGLLWKKLIHSPHRDIFLKWLFKQKQNGKVTLNHSLIEQHRRYLLSNLWNTAEQVKFITESETIFMIELFKTVNIIEHKMNRFNLVIRPVSFELEAYEKLWTVFTETQNEKVADILCDFLAQVHTSYMEPEVGESIQNLVETISANIKSVMDSENITFLTRMLKLTNKLIARDQQSFKCPQNGRMNFYRQYTVLNRDNGQSKVFRFNCMNYFFEFKKLIAEKFNIPIYKLLVFNARQQQLKLEAYYKSMNELMLNTPKFQIMEDLEYESIVKNCLNKKLDLFFALLDDQRISKIVWGIVQKLPISDDLKFKLVETENLLEELNSVGFYKELYELKVVLELPDQWWGKFISSPNFNALVGNLDKVNFKTHIELEYVQTLSEIINKMLTISQQKQIALEISENMIQKLLDKLKHLLISIEQDGGKNSESQIQIIKNLFTIINNLNQRSKIPVINELIQYKNCQELLTLGLLRMPSMNLRRTFYQQLKTVFIEPEPAVVQAYLDLLLIRMLKVAVGMSNDKKIKEYFLFTSFCLSQVDQEAIAAFKEQRDQNICQYLFKLIQQQQPQQNNEASNMLLIGYISLLKHFITNEQSEQQIDISTFILTECLFGDSSSRCKTKASRSQAFSLLRMLMCHNAQILEQVCGFTEIFHKKGQWRTRRLDDWTITLMDKMKSSTGYVGIKNLGCICYMNSFMQNLFMIPRFRYALTNCSDPLYIPELKQQNLLYQVQKIFLTLWNSDKKYYIPKEFCNAFKDYEGNPTNVAEQMDIDEFSQVLFDRLELQMKDTTQPTLIKDMFGGVFSNEIVCKDCPHYSQTEQNFLSISLTVKNKKNIYQSFDTMIKGDNLDGDNAYFCERCSKKVSAVKRVSLKKLPDYLIVTLKRFQFDYVNMVKLKVNDYCQFPTQLNLKQYSRQYLRKQESTKMTEDEEEMSNDYFSYVLKGVVVHLGYADSGHYYSFIQDRNNNKWFEFNDTIVRNFNFDDIAEEAYGGQTSGYDSKQKIKNAYMLIYQRVKKINEPEQLPDPQQIMKKEYNKAIIEEIMNDNREQKIQNILFSKQYNEFVNDLLDNLDQIAEKDQKTLLKYIITVFLTVTVREKTQNCIPIMLKKIYKRLQVNVEMQQWVLRLFCQRRILEQFFKNCIIRQVKRTLAFWLVDLYLKNNRQTQELFLNLLLNKMTQQNDNQNEYCLMLHEISSQHQLSMDYLLKNGVVGRFIENVVRKNPRIFVEKLQMLPDEQSQIGNEIIFERSESQLVKKAKMDNQNAYVWALINRVISRSKQLNVPLNELITETEVGYLRLPEPKILKIIEEIRNKFQLYQFTNFISYLTINNKSLVLSLNKGILQGLKDFQSKRYRQFFLLFEKLIKVSDELTDIRLQGFRSLQEGLICNEKYSLDSNIIQQWIIILVNRNANLRAHIEKDLTLVNFMMKAATKKIPSEQIARKNNAYADFMINKLHGVKFPKTRKNYQKLCEDMAYFYDKMLDGRFEESNIWPLEPETQSLELKVGDLVAYFDKDSKVEYEQAKIQSIFLGKLELSLKKSKSVQLWKDDERVSLDLKFIHDEQNELNSSRTTEMDMEEDEQDYYDI